MEHWLDLDQGIFKIDNLTENKAFKIILGNRQEPLITEAIYENYTMQMNCYERYSPYLPMLFLKLIQDADICIKFLELKIYKTPSFKYKIETILKFLQMNYADEKILEFFSNVKRNDLKSSMMFSKIASNISMIDNSKYFFKEYKNTRCTLQDLFDATVDYLRSSNEKLIRGTKFKTPSIQLEPCIKINGYEVNIIQTGDELVDWSNHLKNDIFFDHQAISSNETRIYGFFKDNSLEFIVKISGILSISSGAFKNEKLNSEQEEAKDRWLYKFFAPKKVSDRVTIEIVY